MRAGAHPTPPKTMGVSSQALGRLLATLRQTVGDHLPLGSPQREREGRPYADGAFHAEITFHTDGEVATDRESETGAFTRVAERAVELDERLEDHLEAIVRYPGACVAHVNQHVFVGRLAAHGDYAA